MISAIKPKHICFTFGLAALAPIAFEGVKNLLAQAPVQHAPHATCQKATEISTAQTTPTRIWVNGAFRPC